MTLSHVEMATKVKSAPHLYSYDTIQLLLQDDVDLCFQRRHEFVLADHRFTMNSRLSRDQWDLFNEKSSRWLPFTTEVWK